MSKESSIKKRVVAAVWVAAIAFWIGIFTYKALADPSLAQWTIAVTAGALALEAAFWATAAVLGMTLLESRKSVARFLMKPFRRNK